MFSVPPLYRWIILIVAVTIPAILSLVSWSLRPVNPANANTQLLRVTEGASIASIADDLASRDLIRSPLAFRSLARLRGTTAKVGLYHVSTAQAPAEILTALGVGDVSETTVTFLEGWRVEELAQRLVQADLVTSSADFIAAAVVTDQTPQSLVDRFALNIGDSLEGFLFPDTYRFATDASADEIVAKLLANFARRTAELELTYDDLILASIVEREALFDEDRPAVAGVYANRLRIGMKLDADPTVQYAKASNEYQSSCHSERLESASGEPRVEESSSSDQCSGFNFWPQVTTRDYDLVESPYNTYRTRVLPPTPISNPGLASLAAAATPADHDFFYFLHDATGATHFARAIDEHNRNKAEFLR